MGKGTEWLKKYFTTDKVPACKHDWECISNVWICTTADVQYKCRHCGKVEGLK